MTHLTRAAVANAFAWVTAEAFSLPETEVPNQRESAWSRS
jgi:hypothetical protein